MVCLIFCNLDWQYFSNCSYLLRFKTVKNGVKDLDLAPFSYLLFGWIGAENFDWHQAPK